MEFLNKNNDDKLSVKIKLVDNSLPLPKYHTKGAVAFDIYSRHDVMILPMDITRISTNLIIEVPKGYMLYLKDRSGTAKKGILITAGIVDQDFCGPDDEILLQFFNPTQNSVSIKRGERIAQGIFVRINQCEWEEVDEMTNQNRGGFGSTGNAV